MCRQICLLMGSVIALALAGPGCQAQPKCPPAPKPATKPASVAPATQPAYSVTDMRVQTAQPMTYFYTAARTNFQDIGTAVDKAMAGLKQAAGEGHVIVEGPPTFVYLGATEDPVKPFDLQIGVPVAAGTKPWGEFKVRDLPAFHNASVILLGPVSSMGMAYQKLIPAMVGAGLTPSNETHEVYLVFEGPESPNNITLVEVGTR